MDKIIRFINHVVVIVACFITICIEIPVKITGFAIAIMLYILIAAAAPLTAKMPVPKWMKTFYEWATDRALPWTVAVERAYHKVLF